MLSDKTTSKHNLRKVVWVSLTTCLVSWSLWNADKTLFMTLAGWGLLLLCGDLVKNLQYYFIAVFVRSVLVWLKCLIYPFKYLCSLKFDKYLFMQLLCHTTFSSVCYTLLLRKTFENIQSLSHCVKRVNWKSLSTWFSLLFSIFHIKK